jgi:hypothetical protein
MKIKYLLSVLFFTVMIMASALERQDCQLRIPGIRQVYPVDLNGDACLDLVIIHSRQETSDRPSMRSLSVYHYQEGYGLQPDMEFEVGEDDMVFDWGDIDRDGLPELVFIRPDGVLARHPGENVPKEEMIINASSLFTGADPAELPRWPVLMNIKNDPVPEIVLPAPGGFMIFSKDTSGEYQVTGCCTIPCKYAIRTGNSLVLETRLPRICPGFLNSDSCMDLAFLGKDQLDIVCGPFGTDPGNTCPASRDRRIRFALERAPVSAIESLAPADIEVETLDLNGDRLDDVILSRASRGGFTKSLSQLQLYYNRGGSFDSLPDQVLTAENFFGDHMITDLNADGRPDIVLLQFPIGLVRAARFLITRQLGYSFDLYYMKPDGKYPEIPDRTLSFRRSSKIRDLLKPELAAVTDWNGDGRADILVNVKKDEIAGFVQEKKGFPKKANLKIQIPVSSDHWIGDLNHDGKADLLFWTPESGMLRCNLSGEP